MHRQIKNQTIMYYIIEHKTPHTHNGEPVIKNGHQLYSTNYVLTRDSESNLPDAAKRFKTQDDCQRYIDRWLVKNSVGEYYPKVCESWK